MEDFLVSLSINDLYKSSKNTTWRKQKKKKSIVIYKFLKEHKLIIVDPFDENGNLKMDFTLMESHLTNVGSEMFKKTIPSWERARDKDGNLENLAILEKGLEKIRASMGIA